MPRRMAELALPEPLGSLLRSFSIAFRRPTFQRFLILFVGATVALGRRTVCGCLWAARPLMRGHSSSYHRVFSHARWSPWPLGKVLAAAVLELVPEGAPVVVTADDTTAMHKGPKVYGKGCHHDACRSTHSHVVWRWGHKWVVLAVNVTLPFCRRPWALPVLAALYRPKELDEAEGRRHRTPLVLARQLAAVLVHWFPRREFILLGDGGYASHELARFCRRHRRHLTLVSRLHPRANLYGPPPARRAGAKGRPRVKGPKLACPRDVVARTPEGDRTRATVGWYGGSRRRVQLVSGTGHWYKGGDGLVPVRWVHVRDTDGTHRDEWFYATDPALAAAEVVGYYTGRWAAEVTFQEARRHLGLETTRQRVKESVLRAGPCLLGLFSVVALTFERHLRDRRRKVPVLETDWYAKEEPTFSDAIACVRRMLWERTIFEGVSPTQDFQKLQPRLRNLLLDGLCRVA